MPPKKKRIAWLGSEGRRLLAKDVREGRVTDTMDWQAVYDMRPEFEVGQSPAEARRLFEGRLKSALEAGSKNRNRAARELGFFHADRASVPRPTVDNNGLPRWDRSQAKQLLQQDILVHQKHTFMSARAIRLSRPEYQVYDDQYIAKKIEQTLRTDKFLKQIGGV